MLLQEKERGDVKGVKIGRHGPQVSYLIFADNFFSFVVLMNLSAGNC